MMTKEDIEKLREADIIAVAEALGIVAHRKGHRTAQTPQPPYLPRPRRGGRKGMAEAEAMAAPTREARTG